MELQNKENRRTMQDKSSLHFLSILTHFTQRKFAQLSFIHSLQTTLFYSNFPKQNFNVFLRSYDIL
jgi:hypothetical protein